MNFAESWPQMRPMSEANKESREDILVKLRNDIDSDRFAYLGGRLFVVRHGGFTPNMDYDMGWAIPGIGGWPDHWMEGWWPLPKDQDKPLAQDNAGE